MKIRLNNKASRKALNRLKWMSGACLAFLALNYVFESGYESMQMVQFVEAGEDLSHEDDEVYAGYIKSAKLQSDLMCQQNKQGPSKWSMKQYQEFQARRLQTVLVQKQKGAFYREASVLANTGASEWAKDVKDFDALAAPKKEDGKYKFKGADYLNYVKQIEAQGYVEEYYGKSRCFSGMINNPGVSLLPSGLMGVAYLIFLGYLFLGIAISADIFMEAIETITSQMKIMDIHDTKTGESYQIEVPTWNATMANLTLMAFGSSAPEIILSVLEALKGLGEPSGDLGPSTIVGSAAFNLLVISAVSISAITDGVKKIDDMGVFLTTALFSIFAYVWLYLCLAVNSPGEVTVNEASWTLGFFFILLALAFGADKFNQRKKNKQADEHTDKENKVKGKKLQLKAIAKRKGQTATLAAAQGEKTEQVSDEEMKQIQELFKEILDKKSLTEVPLDQLMLPLKADSLFERFAARKANQIGATKEFLEIKGQKFQMENELDAPVTEQNELVSFKCLHYSVTESAGTLAVTIVKKNPNQDINFGVRTKEGSAKADSDYGTFDEEVYMKKREVEKVVEIKIHDDEEWQPDLEFYIEIYDTQTGEKLSGDDTECKVSILDEDFPGKLAFQDTELISYQSQNQVEIVIRRFDGSDGQYSCTISTEPFLPDDPDSHENAVADVDYEPKSDVITFESGETEKTVTIFISAKEDEETTKEATDGDEDEEVHKKFKVLLTDATPQGIKISAKNSCIVELRKSGKKVDVKEQHQKMIMHFVAQQNPTYGSQFRQAVMLSPSIDEDDLIVSDVTLGEALMHFATIGWKLLFAFIPPVEWGGGWPAFFVALTFIGTITAVVAEVATVLGCTLGLEEAVTAITLVAVGTSLPDTFASMTAARTSPYADSAIGNVTGSNSVNVFVGLGLPWLISSIYQSNRNVPYLTPPGNLAFSVMLFLITSLICFFILILRRLTLGGELGGPSGSRTLSSVILFLLWVTYVFFSSLRAYNLIDGI